MTLTSGVATFSIALADNIGVGDAVLIDTGGTDQAIDASDTLLFISGRNSATSYKLQANNGSVPGDIPINDTYQIYRAYTSLYNAEAGTKNTSIPITFNGGNRDLVANNEEWNIACYANGTTADTTAVTINGWSTGAQNFIKAYTPVYTNEVGVSQRHSGKWDDGKYYLSISTSGYPINTVEDDIRVDGIQMYTSYNSGNTAHFYISTSGGVQEIHISNNIFRGFGAYSTGHIHYGISKIGANAAPGSKVRVWNNLFYDFSGSNVIGRGIESGSDPNKTFYVYNNTFYNIDDNAITASAPVLAKNNIAQNTGDSAFNGSAFLSESDYNISDDTTDTGGANDKINQTVQFVDAANGDFHLSLSDTAARNAGVDLSADANLPFSTDIDGATRTSVSAWDIGADEAATQIFRSVGPGATSSLATDSSHANTITLTSGVATFSVALADSIGVGDAVLVDTGGTDQSIDASDTLLFIHARTSSTVYTLRTHTGATPANISVNDTYQIYRAHTSLSLAEAGTKNTSIPITFNGGNRNLVTNNEEWNIACYANGTTADTTIATIDGWVTAQQNFIKVYTPTNLTEVGASQRHNGKWDDGKYRIAISNNNAIDNKDNYIRIDGIQIKVGGNYGVRNIGISESGTDIRISNNIIRGTDNLGTRLSLFDSDITKALVWNNIVYGGNIGMYVNIGGTAYLYNNTIYDMTDDGIQQYTSGIVIAKNNIIQNSIDGFSGTFDASSDYNISDLASDAPGANSKNSTTVSFANAANKDFHLAQSDTAARNAGANLTADANFPFSNDIDGQLRNPVGAGWDIGADEGTVEFVATVMQSGGNFSTLSSWEDGVDSDLVADTTRVFSHGGLTGNVLANNSISGGTSGATATVVYATATQILLHSVNGVFVSGETLTASAGGTLVISDNGNPASAVAKIDGAWTAADTTNVSIDGWNSGADNYIKLYTTSSARHQGKWDDGKYRLQISVMNASALKVYEENVRIDGLQIYLTNGSDAQRGINITDATDPITHISNNIIKGCDGTSGSIGIYLNTAETPGPNEKLYVWNNIIYDMGKISVNSSGIDKSGTKGNLYFYNNTIVNNTRGIREIAAAGYDLVMINNNIQACTYDYLIDSSGVFSNNISSDATAPGSNSKINAQVKFISTTAGAEDFHLVPDDKFARDAGADLSADANFAFNTDIDGQTRTGAWDAGADETATQIFRSVGPSKTDTLDNDTGHTKNVTLSGGIAVFAEATPSQVGVGDVVIIDTAGTADTIDSADTLLFIHKRNSATSYDLRTQTGATPINIATNDTYQIYRAHTSLTNAEAGTINSTLSGMGFANFNGGNRDLVANNEVWNIACYANGVTADTTTVTVTGWGAGINNFIKIYTPVNSNEVGISQRHSGKWDDGKYKINVDSNQVIKNNTDYVIYDGLQLYNTRVVANYAMGIWSTTANGGATVSNCIIKGTSSDSGTYNTALLYFDSTGVNSAWNNILYNSNNNSGAATRGVGIWIGSNITLYAYNNTVYNCNSGYLRTLGTFVSKNNIVQNCTDGFNGTFNASSDYNISDLVGDTTGGTHDKQATVSFLDAVNKNFCLSSDDTAAKGAGINLSTDSNLSFTDDIRGQSRPASPNSWSIGACESLASQKLKMEGTKVKMEGDIKFE
ncbi:MAG: hypothetical protein UR83_C0015G0007 [Candidatus Moranbacteria bacterium GW2011_GWF2_35_54]|nr:MAG: hypothetical protein UR83_C0015G0007 [Candidatus Moranbacteria bacterium GW2011_GWF2_35_54]